MNHSKDTGGDVFLRAFFVFALLISGQVIHSSITDDDHLVKTILEIFSKS